MLNRWTSRLFRDLLNMVFKMSNGKKNLPMIDRYQLLEATLMSLKNSGGGINLDCDNTNHWEKLPHASTAAKPRHKLWTVLG